jgi:putative ABC transport system permease protein
MRTLLADLRFSLRISARRPGFTLIAVAALALGMGANTAVFSVIRGVLLRDPPYRDPGRLVAIWESNTAGRALREPSSPANFSDWRAQNRCFEDMSAVSGGQATFSGETGADFLFGGWVTPNFFDVLGVKPAVGRGFAAEDSQKDVIILSNALWTRLFGRDPNIVGRQVRFSQMTGSGAGAVLTVIGVMSPDFHEPSLDGFPETEFWFPHEDDLARIGSLADPRAARRFDFLRVFARSKEGVSLEQARSEMSTVSARLAKQYLDQNSPWTIQVAPLAEALAGDVKRPLWLLFGAAALLLLIACANVANLCLARASERRREFAIRAALGGGASRLLRQLLTESLLLALFGGAAGLLLGMAALRGMLGLPAEFLPRTAEVRMDWPVLLFTFACVCATSILFGTLPARQAVRTELTNSLKSAGSGSIGRGRASAGAVLAASEIGLTLMLLATTGLLLRSLWRVEAVPWGFETSHLLTATVRLPGTARDTAPAVRFMADFLTRVDRQPGVTSAGAISAAPLTGHGHNAFLIEGRPKPDSSSIQDAIVNSVTPGYFRAMQIPLRRGRYLAPSDSATSPKVALISEGLALRYFPHEDPLGHRLTLDEKNSYRIEGVVGDVHEEGSTVAPMPQIYMPHSQYPSLRMAIEIRSAIEPSALVSSLRAQLREMDPDLPLYNIRSYDNLVGQTVAPRKFALLLIGGFAALALLLATVGTYGVISYAVAVRTREFGLRMALGAMRADILHLVLRRGLRIAGLGIAGGALASFALTRLFESFLFGVSGHDPLTFAAVAALSVLVAIAACTIPALRATRLDPMSALRQE